MKRIVALAIACLLACPAWAGDYPTPGSAAHRAREQGWIDVDTLPYLPSIGVDTHNSDYNGGGLVLHEPYGDWDFLTFLNDAAIGNAAIASSFSMDDNGGLFLAGQANFQVIEDGGELTKFNEGSLEFGCCQRGPRWTGESMLLGTVDDGVLQIRENGGDHGVLEFYDDNVASINSDEPWNINVYSSNADDEDINVGGITWLWDDVTLDSEDTRIIFFTTVDGAEEVDQLQISNGVSIGDTDLDPDTNWLGFQANTGITSAVHGPFILYFPGDNTNNDNDSTLRLEAHTTNGSFGADGMGSNIDFYAENASGSAVQQATITSEWDGTPTAGAVYGKMRFGMIRNSAYVTEMRIANGVTIGDVVPDDGQGTLLVVNSTNGGEINISDNDDQNLTIGASNGSGNADIEYSGGPLVINTIDAEQIRFATSDTNRWYIDANGSFYSNGVTGGECGAGCINADEMRIDDNPVKFAGYQHMALMAGAGTVPAGGGIAGCTPVSAFDSGSNDIFLRQCSFSASADNAIYFTVPFPESAHLATDLDVYVRWTSATTTDGSDAVIWNATAVCFSDDDSINANAFPAVDAVTDTQTAAGDILSTVTGGSAMSLTPAGSPTDFDTCVIRVSRDADNGSDTFNGTADLISVDLYYVDDLANEN